MRLEIEFIHWVKVQGAINCAYGMKPQQTPDTKADWRFLVGNHCDVPIRWQALTLQGEGREAVRDLRSPCSLSFHSAAPELYLLAENCDHKCSTFPSSMTNSSESWSLGVVIGTPGCESRFVGKPVLTCMV